MFTILLFAGILHCGKSFDVFWNAPIGECQRFNVNINVTKYGIKANNNDGWKGSEITIFYADELGLYPSADDSQVINGGIPQKVNLTQHVEKCEDDINRMIPESNFNGLGVIDYEAWRPLWERNFDKKLIYQILSKQLVKAQHPTWSKHQVMEVAKTEFETAARSFLLATIDVAKRLQPNGKWGYYLFPNCYTDEGKRKCSKYERNLNNKLLWFFNASTAIYPSAYLADSSNLTRNRDYVFRTLQEAHRIRNKASRTTRPIYLYSRIRYRNNLQWYIRRDLENTMKQTHDLGYDGVVIWGDYMLGHNASICTSLKNYLDDTLGPFVQNILAIGYNHFQKYPWIDVDDLTVKRMRVGPQRRLRFHYRRNRFGDLTDHSNRFPQRVRIG